MAEPSGGAERDAEGFGGAGVGSGTGTSGAASGGFGTTQGIPGSSALNPFAGVQAAPAVTTYDLNQMSLYDLGTLIESGRFGGILPGTSLAYDKDDSFMASLAAMGQKGMLSALMGTVGPFSGAVSLARSAADYAGRGLRGLGVSAKAGGFPGGSGEGDDTPSQPSAPANLTALTPTALPPSGNPLLNLAPAAQDARPGWFGPYLSGYSSPRPASPASNQGLPSGQGMLGPLYA